MACAIGLGIFAYAVLALGLTGFLTVPAFIATLCAMSVVGLRGMRDLFVHAFAWFTGLRHKKSSPIGVVVGILLAALGSIVIINCFVPPAAHEWDAVAYHLAAPKVFLQHHRIIFLPTDHHSNFPFLVEMLFTVGLAFNGFALANLFHFAMWALCVVGIATVGKRYFAPGVGIIAALIFAVVPIALWEAGIAYIDLGMSLYLLLAVAAVIEYRQSQNASHLGLAGALMGFALAVKTISLVPFGICAVLLLAERVQWRALRWYLLLGIVVGCPFYIKCWAMTGNPVYPFGYRVFGGIYWNAKLSEVYSGEQRSFGLNGRVVSAENETAEWIKPTATQRISNAFVAPFELVALPRIFYNLGDPGLFNHCGFLLLAFPPLLLFARRRSPSVSWCAVFVVIWFISWTVTMQYVRYILGLAPLLALLGAEGAMRLVERKPLFRYLVGTLLTLQCALTLSWFVPRLFANDALPGQIQLATDDAAQQEYLSRKLSIYDSMVWLNTHTAKTDGVVLFEETRGFYLDREYLWGGAYHSLYIPYKSFRSGADMVDWYLRHGIRYALVNLQFSPFNVTPGELKQAVGAETVPTLFMRWYNRDAKTDESWRNLIGEAVNVKRAVFVPEATKHGAAVLEFVAQDEAR